METFLRIASSACVYYAFLKKKAVNACISNLEGICPWLSDGANIYSI